MHPIRTLSTTLLAAIALVLLNACDDKPAAERAAKPAAKAIAVAPSECRGGRLNARIAGAIEAELKLANGDLHCDSMTRPASEGLRLQFASDIDGEVLAMIVAIPALQRGIAAGELPSNVTLTVEGSGRFFSTPDLDTCWTDVNKHEPIRDKPDRFEIAGTLYCVGGLGEINGDSSVTLSDVEFETVANWGPQ